MAAAAGCKAAGDAAYRAGDHAAAVQHYTEALQHCERLQQSEQLRVLYSNRSAARLALQDFQGALADAQASVAVDASWVKGWFRSAKALQGLGRYETAAQAATKALQLEPGSRDVQQLLLQLKQQAQQQRGGQAGEKLPPPLQQQQQQQHQHQHQQRPWQHLNRLRASLDLGALPQQLVAGSRYLPSPDGTNANLLLLLHGLGDTPAAFTALAQSMQLPQTASLALSGPLAVPETNGGRAWFTAFDEDFELIRPTARELRRTSSLAATLQLLRGLLFDVLPAAGGWTPREVQVLGFSQGGTVALELAKACRGIQQLGGVVAISAGLLEEQLLQSPAASSSGSCSISDPGTDVLISHGDADAVVTRHTVTSTVAVLKAAGCEVQLKTLPGKGHGMISSAGEMRACMAFWGRRLRHKPVDPDLTEV